MNGMISRVALALSLAIAAPALAKPTANPAAEADSFIAAAEKEISSLSLISAQAAWVSATYITDDTQAIAAEFDARNTEMGVRLAKGAAKFDTVEGLSPDTRRKLDILKLGLVLPAPDKPGAAGELAAIAARLKGEYGKGKGTLDGQPINGSDIEEAMHGNRNPDQLKEMWLSWHDNVGTPMHDDYARMVSIANQGAKELGYKDLGAMWRSGYDMPPEDLPG